MTLSMLRYRRFLPKGRKQNMHLPGHPLLVTSVAKRFLPVWIV